MAERAKGAGSITQLANGKWRGSFEAGYTPSGGRRRVSVTATTKRGCENKLREKIRAHQKNRVAPARNLDVKQWLDLWLAERKIRLRPKAWDAEESPMRLYVVPTIGKVKLTDVIPDHLHRVRAVMTAKGLATSYQAAVQRILQQALREATVAGYDVPSGALLMKSPRTHSVPKSTRDAIPPDDAKRMVEVAWQNRGPENQSGHDGSRWIAALLQGMRQGEALGLMWDNVDFENGLIRIDWQLQELKRRDGDVVLPASFEADHLDGQYWLTRPKTGAGMRTIPMIGPMRQALLEWRAIAPENPWGLVWPSVTGRPKYRRTDRREWQALQEAAGVEKLVRVGSRTESTHYVLHEARNTTASLLLAAGVDPFIITQILGHTSITTSQGYMRVAESQKRQAIESVAGLLGLE